MRAVSAYSGITSSLFIDLLASFLRYYWIAYYLTYYLLLICQNFEYLKVSDSPATVLVFMHT